MIGSRRLVPMLFYITYNCQAVLGAGIVICIFEFLVLV